MSVLDTLTSRTVAFFGQARPANIQVLSVSPTRPGAAGAADWAGAGDGDGGVPGVTAVVRFSRTALILLMLKDTILILVSFA